MHDVIIWRSSPRIITCSLYQPFIITQFLRLGPLPYLQKKDVYSVSAASHWAIASPAGTVEKRPLRRLEPHALLLDLYRNCLWEIFNEDEEGLSLMKRFYGEMQAVKEAPDVQHYHPEGQ